MSYQFPAHLLPNGPEGDMSQAGYAPSYNAPAPGPPLAVPTSHEQSLKERKEYFAQASLTLKRSMSTPNVRPRQASVSDPNQAALAADKKRNKLGYHRTSVACGHCRRRKIRCIPSPADIQGRCINCIRLKKECSFYPVDQPPPPPPQSTESRPKAPSGASTGPKVTSASSSPAMTAGQSPDMSQFQQYQHVAMASAQNMAPPMMRPSNIEASEKQPPLSTREVIGERDLVSQGASSASRQFDFSNQPMTNWVPQEATSSSAKPSNLNETWRSYTQESPITLSFSPYTPQGPGSAGWETATNADPNAREEMGWGFVSTGSLPFPSEAQLSSQYAAVPQGRNFGRKSSTISMDMYPAHIATSIAGFEPQGTSLSAGAVPPSGYGSWEQPYTYSKMAQEWEYEEGRDS